MFSDKYYIIAFTSREHNVLKTTDADIQLAQHSHSKPLLFPKRQREKCVKQLTATFDPFNQISAMLIHSAPAASNQYPKQNLYV